MNHYQKANIQRQLKKVPDGRACWVDAGKCPHCLCCERADLARLMLQNATPPNIGDIQTVVHERNVPLKVRRLGTDLFGEDPRPAKKRRELGCVNQIQRGSA